MSLPPPVAETASVALLAEGVDRNWKVRCAAVRTTVALLAEGVDRNLEDERVYLIKL